MFTGTSLNTRKPFNCPSDASEATTVRRDDFAFQAMSAANSVVVMDGIVSYTKFYTVRTNLNLYIT